MNSQNAKTLNINDFRCEVCRLPSEPGVCHLCRALTKLPAGMDQPASDANRHLKWITIAVIAVAFAIYLAITATN